MHYIDLTIPGPPAPKLRHRTSRGRTYTPRKTVDAMDAAAALFRQAAPGWQPWAGPVHLFIDAVFARPDSYPNWLHELICELRLERPKRPDSDNLTKLVKDALNGLAYDDDGQVTFEAAHKRYAIGDEEPHTDVRLVFLPAHPARMDEIDGFVRRRARFAAWASKPFALCPEKAGFCGGIREALNPENGD